MKALSKRQLIEAIVGFALIAVVLVLGFAGVIPGVVFFRCLIGLGFGYALTRGSFGFAGLSNKVCRTGSAKLIRGIMLSVVVGSIIAGALILNANFTVALWVKPISWGLLVGGILFGIGMAFSSCCATGVLQDIPQGFVRALVTLLFFGVGVFLGMPFWTSKFAATSLLGTSSDAVKGIWFVDWFSNGGTNMVVGVVGAILLTVLIAVGISFLSKWYEKKVAKNFPAQEVEVVEAPKSVWEKVFVQKWSMGTTAIVMAVLFGSLLAVTGAGWGASTVHGNWFGSLLVDLGVSQSALDTFVNGAPHNFNVQYFQDAGSMQNSGIIVGAFVALLLSGKFSKVFTDGLKIKPIEILLFAAGGLLMGFGTRLSWGCNVGAFYTPVAQFSLAGWLYFFIIFGGGFVGNKIWKAFYRKVNSK